jgi:hypothetical protein
MFGKHFSILPQYIFKNRSYIVAWLKRKMFGIGVIQTISLGVCIAAIYKYRKRKKEQRERHAHYEEMKEIYADRFECIV